MWRQVVQGEVQLEVTLNDADTAQATFDAPSNIDEDITLTFELTVSDGTVENKDTVNVLVRDGGGVPSATADETKQTPTGEVQEEERTQPVEEGEQNPESQSTQQPSSSSGEEQEGGEEEEDPLAEDDDTNTDTASSPTTTDSAVITSSPNTDDNTNAMTSSSELELQAEGVPEENVQSGTGSFVVTYDLAMADGSDGGDGSIHIRYSGTIRLEAEGDSYRYTISSAEGQCESDQLIDPHTNPPTVATIMYTASADRSDFWLNGDGTLTLLVMGVTTDPRSTIQYCGWPQSISRELPYTIENGIIRSAHSGPIACTNCIVHISWDISVPAPPNMLPPEENNRPPTASAGADQTVNEGDTVTLDGTGSSDPDGDSLRFRWTPQTQSSAVILSDDTSSTPTFTAP